MSTSIVDYWGPRSGGHCGYCNGCGKYSNSIGAEILTCSDYQDLMDQGKKLVLPYPQSVTFGIVSRCFENKKQ